MVKEQVLLLSLLLTCLYGTQTLLLRLVPRAHVAHLTPPLTSVSHTWNALSSLLLLLLEPFLASALHLGQ